MENLLEQQRRLHEERERLENAMADEVLHKKQLVKSRLRLLVYHNRALICLRLKTISLYYARIISFVGEMIGNSRNSPE